MKLVLFPLLATLFLAGCAGTSSRESTGEFIDGASVTTKVKAAFIKDPLVKAFDVKVETFKGTVQLAGFVDTPEQKAKAEELARAVPGVVAVQNNIALKAGK